MFLPCDRGHATLQGMKNLGSLLLSSLLLSGCYGNILATGEGEGIPFQSNRPIPVESSLAGLSADDAFDALAAQTEVPADLLAALAWVGSSFAPVEHDGEHCSPTHGWLGLNDAQIARAAQLMGEDPEAIEADRELNLIAGALLLDELRDQLAPSANGEADAAWWPVVTEFPGFAEEWLGHEFAFDVFATMQRGLMATTADGDVVVIEPRELPGLADVDFVHPPSGGDTAFAAGTDYPGAARFLPAHSSNFSSRSGGTSAIRRVVIHTTEGTYDGAISWFRNSSSDVSAHYVVRRSDGHITQMVRDRDRAWHAAGANSDTIGIEHEGAAASPSTWTTAILESSARLTAWLTLQYDIPVDRDHIVAHSDVTSYKVDPGAHFPWTQYLQLVNCYRTGGDGCDGSVIDTLPGPDEGGGAAPGGSDAGTGSGSGGTGSDGSGSGGSGSGTTAPPAGGAFVEFIAPRDGDVVTNPVTLWAQHDGSARHMEFWSGPWRLGSDVMENPGNRAIDFSQMGNKTLTVFAKSTTGATLATDSVSVILQEQAVNVSVTGQALGGSTWRLDASVAGDEAEYVQFYVDGLLLSDDDTGSNRAPGADYEMIYTFNYLGEGRVLVARAFDADGHLLGEGTTLISVLEDSAAECGIVGTIGCGQQVSGNTATDAEATSVHAGYPDIVGNWEGPELGYEWTAATSGEVEIRFVDPDSTETDLDIIVLAQQYGECVSADATGEIAFTSLKFEAEAGTRYVFVVDGYDGAAGEFTLELDCAPE